MAQSKKVVRFGPFAGFIANGVRKGDTIYLSGQVATDAEGDVVGVGDLAAQIRQAYVNIAEVLSHFDATMDDVVDELMMVTDVQAVMANSAELFGIRAEAYGGNPDVCQTLVQVGALVMPELMVEIKCVAKV